MSETERPMTDHEIGQGLSELLSTVRGDRPAEIAEAEAPTDEEQPDAESLAEPGEEDVDEGESETEDVEVPTFSLKYKYKGQDLEETDEAEAVKYYQLGRHLTERQEEIVSRERAVEERDAEVDQLRARYLEALPQIEAWLRSPLGEPPRREDFEDETAYLKADKAYRDAFGQVQAVQAEHQREQQEQQAKVQKRISEWARTEEQKTLAEIPEWHDLSVREQEVRDMLSYATNVGAPENLPFELTNATWFRRVLRDAASYRKAVDAGSSEVKKTQPKTAAPGSVAETRVEGRTKRLNAMKKRAASGKTDDIAPLASQLVERFQQLTQTR